MQGSNRAQKLCSYDDILDISSGMLHLAGNSLVPESISRDTLQDAKVLLQVDRKFILATAGEILIAIDQVWLLVSLCRFLIDRHSVIKNRVTRLLKNICIMSFYL